MSTISKILFPTDFSPGAAVAGELAIAMAAKFEAHLTLLHVYHIQSYFGAFGEVYLVPLDLSDKMRADAERALEHLRLRAAEVGVTAEPLVLDGIANDAILSTAKKRNIDLIVMGTHGRTGIKHLLIGSVAERVVRTARCPVLTVREPLPDSEHAELK